MGGAWTRAQSKRMQEQKVSAPSRQPLSMTNSKQRHQPRSSKYCRGSKYLNLVPLQCWKTDQPQGWDRQRTSTWGKKTSKRTIISHGGHYVDQVTKETKLLIIMEYPGKSKVEKARSLGIHLAAYKLVQELLAGKISWVGLLAQLSPVIAEYSQGYGPLSILHKSRKPGPDKVTKLACNSEEPGLEEATSSSTCWSLQATTQPIHMYWPSGSL